MGGNKEPHSSPFAPVATNLMFAFLGIKHVLLLLPSVSCPMGLAMQPK